jgi:predicted RNA-binding protein with RPS1 domain
MEGVESDDEAHNLERPARAALKKKKPAGKDLSEFSEGSTVKGTIKSIASYGAFVDIGASTDGLLHVSQLSAGFVSDVSEVVKEGQEVEVRIVKIDASKGQIGLSMMTEEEAAASKPSRPSGGGRGRRDDSALLRTLTEKGWDASVMVEGTVVSTVDFGAFVKVDASALNSECEGSFDGLVHISSLKVGRVNSVSDVVSPNDKVQVRCKGIDGNKVSLTMLSVEDEESKAAQGGGRGGGGGFNDEFDPGEGAKDWKESVAKIDEEQPMFKNGPLIIDNRK